MLSTLSILSLDQGKITASERKRLTGEGEAERQIAEPLRPSIHMAVVRGTADLLRLAVQAVARLKPSRDRLAR